MQKNIAAAPTLVYPESDGEPMAETEKHRKIMVDIIDIIERYFQHVPDVHVSGNLLLSIQNMKRAIRGRSFPPMFSWCAVSPKKSSGTYKTWEQKSTLDFVLELASPSYFSQGLYREEGDLCQDSSCERVLHL